MQNYSKQFLFNCQSKCLVRIEVAERHGQPVHVGPEGLVGGVAQVGVPRHAHRGRGHEDQGLEAHAHFWPERAESNTWTKTTANNVTPVVVCVVTCESLSGGAYIEHFLAI